MQKNALKKIFIWHMSKFNLAYGQKLYVERKYFIQTAGN